MITVDCYPFLDLRLAIMSNPKHNTVEKKKRKSGALAALGNNNWKFFRNNDVIPFTSSPIDRSLRTTAVERSRLSKRNRDDNNANEHNGTHLPDETVDRIIGNTEGISSPPTANTEYTTVPIPPDDPLDRLVGHTEGMGSPSCSTDTTTAPSETTEASGNGEGTQISSCITPIDVDKNASTSAVRPEVNNETHVLLPWLGLKEFHEENFVCKHCLTTTNKNVLEKL